MIKLTENREPENLFIDPLNRTIITFDGVDGGVSGSVNGSEESGVDDKVKSSESINPATFKSDEDESREKLVNALDGYRENFSLTNNPLLAAAEEYSNEIDRDKLRRAEQSASFVALNDIFQNIGGAISAFGGVAAPKVDKSAFNSAMERVDRLNIAESNRHDTLLKSALNIAENYNRDVNTAEKTYVDGMLKVHGNDIERAKNEEYYSYKMSDIDSKEKISNDKLAQQQENNLIKNLSAAGKKSSDNSDGRYDRYVYNGNGDKVGLTKEMVTKLHQVAKLHNIDLDYNAAPNMQKSQHEYDIMIQDAYLIYEKKDK